MTLFREAILESDAQTGLCVVKNLSSGGAMVRTSLMLQVDQSVTLVMSSGRRAQGRLRWRQGDLSGMAFDASTPPSWLLDRYAECDDGITNRQLPRVSIAVPVAVTDRAGPETGMTCDLSTHGLRLASNRVLGIGPVAIELHGLGRISARVLWSVDAQSGCIFDRPFSIDDVTRWLAVQESRLPQRRPC